MDTNTSPHINTGRHKHTYTNADKCIPTARHTHTDIHTNERKHKNTHPHFQKWNSLYQHQNTSEPGHKEANLPVIYILEAHQTFSLSTRRLRKCKM